MSVTLSPSPKPVLASILGKTRQEHNGRLWAAPSNLNPRSSQPGELKSSHWQTLITPVSSPATTTNQSARSPRHDQSSATSMSTHRNQQSRNRLARLQSRTGRSRARRRTRGNSQKASQTCHRHRSTSKISSENGSSYPPDVRPSGPSRPDALDLETSGQGLEGYLRSLEGDGKCHHHHADQR